MKIIIYALLFAGGIVSLNSVDASGQVRGDLRYLLKRLEDNSDRFEKSLDHALDHSSLNGSRSEDEINAYVHDFEEATDRLKDHYKDRGYDLDNTREVLLRARRINCFMRRHDLGLRAAGDWQVVRSDINAWARANGINGVGNCSPQLQSANPRRTVSRSSYVRVKKTTRARTTKSGCRCP